MRNAEISRKTAETEIELWLDLDGSGNSSIDTGVGFMDHMLTLLAKHARFDLMVNCTGDTYVDDHHSVEDIGISLGKAFADALGDKRGINRYGDTTLAMDEALVLTSIDISGRSYLGYDLEIPNQKVGTFDTELVEEFLMGFVRTAGVTLHVVGLKGKNTHHIIECLFKSLARTLRHAVAIDAAFADDIPSTKGVLDDAAVPGGIVDEEIPGADFEDDDYSEETPDEEVSAEEDGPEEEDFEDEDLQEETVPEELEEEFDDFEDAYDEVGDLDYEELPKASTVPFKAEKEPEPYVDLMFDDVEPASYELNYDYDDDPDVDDVDRLAEQMARSSLFEQRSRESTGLDEDYARGLARGYTGMDIPVRDVDDDLSGKGL